MNASMFTKFFQVITTLNSRKSCPVEVIPKDVKFSEFLPFSAASDYESIENTSIFSENPTYTIKDEEDDFIRGEFCQQF